MKVNIEKVEELIFEWDWEKIVIPNKCIKSIKYDEKKRDSYYTHCSNVIVEMDSEYIKENNITENFKQRDIWGITIKYKNGEKISLMLPSYRKASYCGEKSSPISWDNENLCEHHQIKEETYMIEWKELPKQELNMDDKEMSNFFKNGNLISVNQIYCLGIEILNRVLDLKVQEYSLLNQIKQKYDRDKVQGEYKDINGFDTFTINIENNCNVNFILVPNLDNESDKQLLDKTINDINNKEFSICITIVSNNIKQLESEKTLSITYSEFNKMWQDIHEEWDLL